MLTEDYNGVCPNCMFNRMMVRYGSLGYWQYDACTKCGFAYASNHYDGEQFGEEVWKGILEAEKDNLARMKFPATRDGMHKYILSLPEPTEQLPSVFQYKTKKEIEACTR